MKKKGLVHTMEKRATRLADDVRHTADELAEKTREAGLAALETARSAYEAAESSARSGAKATNYAVHHHPYQFLGAAFGIGILLGLLLKKR